MKRSAVMKTKVEVTYGIKEVGVIERSAIFDDWFDFADWLKQRQLAGQQTLIKGWEYIQYPAKGDGCDQTLRRLLSW